MRPEKRLGIFRAEGPRASFRAVPGERVQEGDQIVFIRVLGKNVSRSLGR